MADYLVGRGSFWRFVRRVPKEYEALDPRGIVQQSTKICIADDPRAIRARKVALGYNAALEAYWHDLVNTDSAQAVRDYEAARAAARRLGISPPIDSASARTLADILSRIERLMDKAGAADDRATLKAVYDAAPKPGISSKQAVCRAIHRSARTVVIECETRQAVEGNARNLRLPGDQQCARRADRRQW